jgi:glycosyltransferase involved in cell wall biosynthesis
MNCRAIDTLFASETWSDGEPEVLLIESNRESAYKYDRRVRVLMPEEKFGFHRFFNIGLDHTSGEFVAFCNNDIVFENGWWSEIMKVKTQHPKFMCFSPVNSSYPMMAEEIATGKEYTIGWENKRHFAAWCFVWERKVFETIGRFDETFDFYSADDDELQTLHYWAIPNVLVTGSEVKHLSQIVTKKVGINKYAVTDKEKYPLSDYEIKRGYKWLWDDVRFYVAHRR